MCFLYKVMSNTQSKIDSLKELNSKLLAEISDNEKREIFAVSYEQRAKISQEKAEQFDQQFHRPFPLIKLEAQKDRLAAQQVRQGRRVRRDSAANKMLRVNDL